MNRYKIVYRSVLLPFLLVVGCTYQPLQAAAQLAPARETLHMLCTMHERGDIPQDVKKHCLLLRTCLTAFSSMPKLPDTLVPTLELPALAEKCATILTRGVAPGLIPWLQYVDNFVGHIQANEPLAVAVATCLHIGEQLTGGFTKKDIDQKRCALSSMHIPYHCMNFFLAECFAHGLLGYEENTASAQGIHARNQYIAQRHSITVDNLKPIASLAPLLSDLGLCRLDYSRTSALVAEPTHQAPTAAGQTEVSATPQHNLGVELTRYSRDRAIPQPAQQLLSRIACALQAGSHASGTLQTRPYPNAAITAMIESLSSEITTAGSPDAGGAVFNFTTYLTREGQLSHPGAYQQLQALMHTYTLGESQLDNLEPYATVALNRSDDNRENATIAAVYLAQQWLAKFKTQSPGTDQDYLARALLDLASQGGHPYAATFFQGFWKSVSKRTSLTDELKDPCFYQDPACQQPQEHAIMEALRHHFRPTAFLGDALEKLQGLTDSCSADIKERASHLLATLFMLQEPALCEQAAPCVEEAIGLLERFKQSKRSSAHHAEDEAELAAVVDTFVEKIRQDPAASKPLRCHLNDLSRITNYDPQQALTVARDITAEPAQRGIASLFLAHCLLHNVTSCIPRDHPWKAPERFTCAYALTSFAKEHLVPGSAKKAAFFAFQLCQKRLDMEGKLPERGRKAVERFYGRASDNPSFYPFETPVNENNLMEALGELLPATAPEHAQETPESSSAARAPAQPPKVKVTAAERRQKEAQEARELAQALRALGISEEDEKPSTKKSAPKAGASKFGKPSTPAHSQKAKTAPHTAAAGHGNEKGSAQKKQQEKGTSAQQAATPQDTVSPQRMCKALAVAAAANRSTASSSPAVEVIDAAADAAEKIALEEHPATPADEQKPAVSDMQDAAAEAQLAAQEEELPKSHVPAPSLPLNRKARRALQREMPAKLPDSVEAASSATSDATVVAPPDDTRIDVSAAAAIESTPTTNKQEQCTSPVFSEGRLALPPSASPDATVIAPPDDARIDASAAAAIESGPTTDKQEQCTSPTFSEGRLGLPPATSPSGASPFPLLSPVSASTMTDASVMTRPSYDPREINAQVHHLAPDNYFDLQTLLESRKHVIDTKWRHKISGDTPLHAAVAAGNLDTARILLAYGYDPLATNDDGITPLCIARSSRPRLLALLKLYLPQTATSPEQEEQVPAVAHAPMPGMPPYMPGMPSYDHLVYPPQTATLPAQEEQVPAMTHALMPGMPPYMTDMPPYDHPDDYLAYAYPGAPMHQGQLPYNPAPYYPPVPLMPYAAPMWPSSSAFMGAPQGPGFPPAQLPHIPSMMPAAFAPPAMHPYAGAMHPYGTMQPYHPGGN